MNKTQHREKKNDGYMNPDQLSQPSNIELLLGWRKILG